MTECPHGPIPARHKDWVMLEDEHYRLAVAIDTAGITGSDLALMRERPAMLLLEINSVVAAIRDAPATTTAAFIALLDVALDHELDLAGDRAFYAPAGYPMIASLLR